VSFESRLTDNGFVDQICRQWRRGNAANASRSGCASVSIAATFGWDRPSIVVTSRNCFSMCSRSGWAKIVRMIDATISWDPFGTTARTLRMKWTRHLCQPAPWNTVAMAFFNPV
jgi:hypothetical protein